MPSLNDLGLLHGTDKSTKYHGYTILYERYFEDTRFHLRGVGGSLLELGWGGHGDPLAGGQSARMWRDWLPGWQITVIDNEDKIVSDVGITFKKGDQADAAFIHRLASRGPFDIIVDDASHISSKSIRSFELLWPHLKPGGWYVVEDTHSSYHSFYYGQDEANPDPAHDELTMLGFLKRMSDEANFQGRDEWDLFPAEFWLGYEIGSVHFHFNICFVQKR